MQPASDPPIPYTPYVRVLAARGLGGRRIRKVTLNGGFTCPNLDGTKARGGCTYCDNRAFSPAAGSRGLSITRQLEQGTAWLRTRLGADGFIAYFQTYSGTYAPVARLEALYEEALAFPGVAGLAVGTRPDCLDARVVDLLDRLSRRTYVSLELGLQSAFDETLRRVNRAHGFAEFAAAMDLCRGRGFDLCVHLILGLPGEGPPHWRETVAALGRWEYHSLKVHPLHVVRGTALARQHAQGEYLPLERQAYVEALVDVLERVPPEVGVQRYTGDAPEGLLIAPLWCRDKAGLREDMLAEFRRRGTRQGHRLKAGRRALEAGKAAESTESTGAIGTPRAPDSVPSLALEGAL